MNLKQAIIELKETKDLVKYLVEDDIVSKYLRRELKSTIKKLKTMQKENE